VSQDNLLGEYLRARRELVTPEMAGLPVTGTRRVAGLRREEVALLAGISSDYYLRLEQGRDRHPSVQVLEAIARVLRLDEPATDYLLGLAAPRLHHRHGGPAQEIVPATIRQLLEVLGQPAFVEGRYFDVLAANELAGALSPSLQAGRNRLLSVFLDPAERTLYPDWDDVTARLLADFRTSAGNDVGDQRFAQLRNELSRSSDRFRQLWSRHEVQSLEGMPTRIHHPRVGDLTLNRDTLGIGGTDRQLLVIYYAPPGTSSAEKMALLGCRYQE
jgi:transcriptional regulator with XRE-family HTH domain